MPDWTYNTLTIRGSKETLEAIVNLLHDEDIEGERTALDFNKVDKCPDELIKTPQIHYHKDSPEYANREKQKQALKEKYGFDGWYDWCVENWGTKWNASEVVLHKNSPTEIVYTFDTAWSCPLPIIEKLSKRFHDTVFTIEAHTEMQYSKSFVAIYLKGKEAGYKTIEHRDLTDS